MAEKGAAPLLPDGERVCVTTTVEHPWEFRLPTDTCLIGRGRNASLLPLTGTVGVVSLLLPRISDGLILHYTSSDITQATSQKDASLLLGGSPGSLRPLTPRERGHHCLLEEKKIPALHLAFSDTTLARRGGRCASLRYLAFANGVGWQ